MLRRLCALLLVLGLAACAGLQPTPYQARANHYGYAEEPLEEAAYRVSFAGNPVTPRETVADYLLYRAAELTLERGHERFAVLDKMVEKEVHHRLIHDHAFAHHGFFFQGHRHPFHHNTVLLGPYPGGYYTSTRYTAVATIRPFSGSPPAGAATIHDARAVMKRLGPVILQPTAANRRAPAGAPRMGAGSCQSTHPRSR